MEAEETIQPRAVNLRRFNHALSTIVVLLALYILLLPFLPQLEFWFNQRFGRNSAPLVLANKDDTEDKNETYPEKDTLVIPSINLQQEVFAGPSSGVLDKGIWHRPNTSVPGTIGNTVIVGHRFTYAHPKGEFYHLDKIKTGDKIVAYWQKNKFIYTVEDVFVAKADNLAVEGQSNKPMLTLYTCTPLWSAKDRLVIQASLKEQIL